VPPFNLPIVDNLTGTAIVYDDTPNASEFAFYRLGTVTYDDIEVQRLQRVEFYNIDKSDLTLPSENFPVYLYESGKLNIKPPTIQTDVEATFLRKPKNVIWNFQIPTGENYYEYVAAGSQDFELHSSEQVDVITRILLYAGVVVKDYQIVQLASKEIQQNEINQKS
jgi:hypothetical protein